MAYGTVSFYPSAFPLMSSPSVWECSVLHAAKRALGSAHRRLHVCPLKLSDWHQGQAGSPSLLLLCHSPSLHHLHLTLPVSLTLSLSPCFIAPPPHLCMERKASWSYVDYPCSFFSTRIHSSVEGVRISWLFGLFLPNFLVLFLTDRTVNLNNRAMG